MSGPGLGFTWGLQGIRASLRRPQNLPRPCAGHIDGFIVSFNGEDLLLM